MKKFGNSSMEPIVAYIAANQMEVGQQIIGTYKGSFENDFGTTHKLQTSSGLVGLNGCGTLNKILPQVPADTTLLIVYQGTQTMKSGKKPGAQAHQFDVTGYEAGDVIPEDDGSAEIVAAYEASKEAAPKAKPAAAKKTAGGKLF